MMTISMKAVIAFAVLTMGGFYLWCVQAANDPFDWSHDKVEFYDMLGRAFAQGQFHLPLEPPPELLALPDPWDPQQNGRFAAYDLVLFKGRYYLYHGATPALILFAPWRLLTRHDLPEPFGAFLFCFLGYQFSCALFLRLLDAMGARPHAAVLGLLLLALGICQGAPFLLQRVLMYEVAIAAGYFSVSAAFWALAEGVLFSSVRPGLLAVSGLMFGLGVGCRPHLVIYAVAAGVMLWLLVRRLRPLAFFTAGLAVCLIAIALYNYARFANPLEFGLRYQLARDSYYRIGPALMNLAPGIYYFLVSTPVWEPVFPFLRLAIRVPLSLPARYFVEPIAGVLAICPAAIAGFAATVALPRREIRTLARTICFGSLAVVLAIASLGLVSPRYELDFLPTLVLLACLLAVWRWRLFAGALLLYSAIANLALGVQGPYDQFVQRYPTAYVSMARWFSPIARFRPLYNPAVEVEASFEFPQSSQPGPMPLISAGRFGSHYQVTAEMVGNGKVRLTSVSPLIPGTAAIAEVDAPRGTPVRVRLVYLPERNRIVVDWNGQTVIRQEIPFLVTAPEQVNAGEYRTDFGPVPFLFPGRVFAVSKTVHPYR
ncbi:MAG TPA: hypothetical protein VKU01_28340 [Bryobacteraceae bacterium]|nr:hypothetical protein [Bryobacteraceae bacterium]